MTNPDTVIIPAHTWHMLHSRHLRAWLARERRTRTAMRHIERRARRHAWCWAASWFVREAKARNTTAPIVRVIGRAMRARSVPRALRRVTLPRVAARDLAEYNALHGRRP